MSRSVCAKVRTVKITTIALLASLLLVYTTAPSVLALDVPFFSQQNPLWSEDQLGNCTGVDEDGHPYNIHYYGCATSSKAMVFNYYQPDYTNPGQLNSCLKEKGGYVVNGCDALWNNICAPPGVTFTDYIKSDGSDINSIIDLEISNCRPVIAKVHTNTVPMHFVVITGKGEGTYTINDPFDLEEGVSKTLDNGYFGSYDIDALYLYHGVPPAKADPTVKWHPNTSLLKIEGSPSIYLLENGKKRHIPSPEIFEAHKFKWSDVITISQEELNAYPSGPNIEEIKTDDPNNGKVLRAEDDYRVYWIQNGVKRHVLCPEILEYYSWKSEDVLVVQSWDVAKYPDGPAVGNGLLVKKTDDPTVYVIENGKKRGFTTPTAFEKLGYSWCNIIDVSAESFNAIDLGWPISDELIDSNDNIEILAAYKDWLGASTSGHYIDPDNSELGVQCDYEKGKIARQKTGESYLRIPSPEQAASQAALSASEIKLSVCEKVKLFVEDVGDRTIYWFNQGWQNLKGALHFKGSQLKLQVFNPDGTLYNEWQTSQPPLLVDLSTLPTGTIKFKVSPVDVPTYNYPFALTLGTASAVGGNPWPMFGHDAQHTGRSSYAGPQTNDVKWAFDFGYPSCYSFGRPVIALDGTIYVGFGWMYEGKLYAINPDGTLKWSHDTDSCPTAPAIDLDGTIYVGGMDFGDYVYAINPDGTLKWTYYTGNAVYAVTIGPDGTVYFTSETGLLYALNPDGMLKWSYDTGTWAVSSPTISHDSYIIISSKYYVYAINPDGTLRWSIAPIPGEYPSTACIGSDGTIYVTANYYVCAISHDGDLAWTTPLQGKTTTMPAIGQDGTIYVGSGLFKYGGGIQALWAISPDGTIKWHQPFNEPVSTCPIVGGNGTIYVGIKPTSAVPSESVDRFFATEPINGNIKWSYPLRYLSSIATIGLNGTLYIQMLDDESIKLYAFGSSLVEDAVDQLPENFEVASKYYDTISQSESKVYSFNIDSKKNLGGVLNWSGNELLFRVFSPDETLYGEYQISTPPFTITIPKAEPGIWQFEISSANILDGDYPFALVTGFSAAIVTQIDLKLTQGWNLVSSRIALKVADADKFSSATKFTSVWKWEWVNDKYKWAVYLPGESTPGEYATAKGFADLTTISPGDGFWVNSKTSQNVTVTGAEVSSSDISLVSGWNLKGLKTDTSINVSFIFSDSQKFASVWKWAGAKWAVYLPGEATQGAYAGAKAFEVLSTINPGEGFWVNCSEAITLQTPINSPTATITSPSDGSTYTDGDSITFSGSGSDAEDGTLTGNSLVWTSDKDGQIGTGQSFTINSLSVNTYTVTLFVTDYNGAVGTDSVTITINPVFFAQSWTQVNTNGFGDHNNTHVGDVTVLNNELYVSTFNWVSGTEIWRSQDGQNWQQINEDGFGDSNNWGAYILSFNGSLFVSTYNYEIGAELWRSTDGLNWEQVNADGFGDPNNTSLSAIVYEDYLYIATNNWDEPQGCDLWRSMDGENWQKIVDDGFGDKNNAGGGFTIFGSYLYFAIGNYTSGVQIWRTIDGVTWENVNGYGWENTKAISGLSIFKDFLYISTTPDAQIWRTKDGNTWYPLAGGPSSENTCGSFATFKDNLYIATTRYSKGFEIWRSLDGISWQQVVFKGFWDPNNIGGQLTIFEDYLYVTTSNWYSTGMEVWRSTDGLSWEQVNIDGFGDSNNSFAQSIVFEDFLYVTTFNEATGVEVWRTGALPISELLASE